MKVQSVGSRMLANCWPFVCHAEAKPVAGQKAVPKLAMKQKQLKQEDSANEHDGCSEVSASSVNQEAPKQADPEQAAAEAAAERSRAEKGKGKLEEQRRRNDSASSLRWAHAGVFFFALHMCSCKPEGFLCNSHLRSFQKCSRKKPCSHPHDCASAGRDFQRSVFVSLSEICQ